MISMPTKLIDTNLMEAASDDWLADLNNDGIADMLPWAACPLGLTTL